MLDMLAIRADRSPLMDRVHRDAKRFRLGMIWGELKQVAISTLMVAFAVLLTARTGLRGPLRWVAMGLMALPALAILVRRVYLRSNCSAPAPGLSESIAGAIRETENQLQRMNAGDDIHLSIRSESI